MSQQEFKDKLEEFQKSLLNLADLPKQQTLEGLWKEVFQFDFPKEELQKIQVNQGSSNMVQVVDVVNDGIKEKVAIRISKKNGYFNTGLSNKEKGEILNWYTRLEPRDALKVRMELRDCAKNGWTTTATLKQLGKVVERFPKKKYEEIQIENGKQLKFLHYISQEIQSYINWNAFIVKNKEGTYTDNRGIKHNYSPRIKIYAYKFIKYDGRPRLCVIMQAGDFDLSRLYSCRKQKGPNLKFEPNDDAKNILEAIRLETAQALKDKKFKDEIIWQQQDENKNYSPMDLELSDPNIFNMTELYVPDYLTSLDVLVAYKIFEAFDSQIQGLELLCTDIKPGNIVIVFKFDALRKEVVVNFNIFVIDIDSDWCDNIFWTDAATATTKGLVIPNHKLTTKIFLTNQFFYWPGIKKNIFCQYWVNRSHSSGQTNPPLSPDSVNATLCDDTTQLAKDWIRMLIHYQKHTKQQNKKWCESLVSLLTRNIYFLNETDAAVQPLSSSKNTQSSDLVPSKSNIGRKSPAQEGALAQFYINVCGFFGIGGRRKTRRLKKKSKRGKKKSKRGKKKSKRGKKSRRGKKTRRGKKY